MQCQGSFKFRSLDHIDPGVFINNNGEQIAYKESYKLNVDEFTDKGLQVRIFKIAPDSPLLPILQEIKPYQDLIILFDIQVYSNGVRLVPVSIKTNK